MALYIWGFFTDSCGGVRKTPSGNISYISDIAESCVWKFEFKTNETLYFSLMVADLQPDVNLTFYNNYKKSEIITFTGKQGIITILTMSIKIVDFDIRCLL